MTAASQLVMMPPSLALGKGSKHGSRRQRPRELTVVPLGRSLGRARDRPPIDQGYQERGSEPGQEVEQLSRKAPRYAADLRRNATFRDYDNRYHITAELVRDVHRLPQQLGHLVGPHSHTVQAASFIAQAITVPALGFLLLLHGREYVNLGFR